MNCCRARAAFSLRGKISGICNGIVTVTLRLHIDKKSGYVGCRQRHNMQYCTGMKDVVDMIDMEDNMDKIDKTNKIK